MKKVIGVCLLVFFAFSVKGFSQRYAVIDMKYILGKIPEYKDIDITLQKMSKQWQSEITKSQSDLDLMRKNFEAEQYMLSDELKEKRKIEISNKEKITRDLQNHYFGYQGELFQERQRLVQPIQEKVYSVVQNMAVTRGYDFILDKSEGITVIFADPKLNRSDDVLKALGVKTK